jgi:DNA-binding transcriptional MerR regulator
MTPEQRGDLQRFYGYRQKRDLRRLLQEYLRDARVNLDNAKKWYAQWPNERNRRYVASNEAYIQQLQNRIRELDNYGVKN